MMILSEIVGIGAILLGSVFLLRWAFNNHSGADAERHPVPPPRVDPDAARLREEVSALKDRIAVLERIATDRAVSLDHEIERLRDR